VADGEQILRNPNLNLRMQIKQAKRIRHRRAAAAHFEGDVFLPHSEFTGQASIALGFFDRVEIGPLQILDERELEDFKIAGGTNNNRHMGKTHFLSGAPTTLARDQLVPALNRADDERLNNAVLLDGIDQLLQGVPRKFLARLKRAGCDAAQDDLMDFFAGVSWRGRGRRPGTDQCAQAFSERRPRHVAEGYRNSGVKATGNALIRIRLRK
jgi:hypothetical protein